MSKKVRTTLFVAVPLIGVGAIVFSFLSPNETPSPAADEVKKANVPVTVAPVREMEFLRSLNVIGSVEAVQFALVSPRVQGTLDKVFVDEGSRVEAGVTPLFQVDAANLSKAVEIAQQQYKVSMCSIEEKRASLELVEADKEKAQRDFERAASLHADNVMTTSLFEAEESRLKQATASVKHAKVLIDLAEEQCRQSQLQLAVAEKNLRDSTAIAPISGFVCQRFKEPGEMGMVGVPVLKIENPSRIAISIFLPEEYYGLVTPGQTQLEVALGDLELGSHAVSYRSPNIDEKLRTFEVKCEIENPPAAAAPGRIAQATVILERRKGLGVPRDALEVRGGHENVFLADGTTARIIAVSTGLETDGYVELQGNADLPVNAGQPVITEGAGFVEDGTAIEIVEGN